MRDYRTNYPKHPKNMTPEEQEAFIEMVAERIREAHEGFLAAGGTTEEFVAITEQALADAARHRRLN